MTADAFAAAMAAQGVPVPVASFLHTEFLPYYLAGLTPYPCDRVYADLRIDPDDLSDIAIRFEKAFGRWLGEVPLDVGPDPSLATLGLALART